MKKKHESVFNACNSSCSCCVVACGQGTALRTTKRQDFKKIDFILTGHQIPTTQGFMWLRKKAIKGIWSRC